MALEPEQLKNIIEAALLANGKPMSIDRLLTLFVDEHQPSRDEIRDAIRQLQQDCEGRGIELSEVGSGFRFQVKQGLAPWISRLWEEKPGRYSRALMETLALIAYRQPITRAEIEEVRGVAVSTNIIKTLLEREWVRVVGHRDVPGKPAMYATTRQFLDYFNLKSLNDLPPLAEIRDIDSINAELDLDMPDEQHAPATGAVPENDQPLDDEDSMLLEPLTEASPSPEDAVAAEMADTENSEPEEPLPQTKEAVGCE